MRKLHRVCHRVFDRVFHGVFHRIFQPRSAWRFRRSIFVFALCSCLLTTAYAPAAHADERYSVGKNICYVALGDSVTAGWGAPPVKGVRLNGYVGLLYRQFLTRGPVEMHNLGVPGLTSGQFLFLLEHWPDASRFLSRAHLITLSIGGNDIIWTDHQSPGDAVKMRENLKKYAQNIDRILHQIRSLNPQARLFLLEVYNPFPPSDPRHEPLGEWIDTVNRSLASAADKYQANVVPTASLFLTHENEYVNLANNDIHPNLTGHTRIAEYMSQALLGRFIPLPVQPNMQPNLLWNGRRKQLHDLLLVNDTIYISAPLLHTLFGPRLEHLSYRLGAWWLRVNHHGVKLSSPVLFLKGQPFLPLRAIGESLGAKVYWVEDSQTISLFLD